MHKLVNLLHEYTILQNQINKLYLMIKKLEAVGKSFSIAVSAVLSVFAFYSSDSRPLFCPLWALEPFQ